jgi:putative cell wall-binding protein
MSQRKPLGRPTVRRTATAVIVAAVMLSVLAAPASADHGGASVGASSQLPALPTEQTPPEQAAERCGSDGVRCIREVEQTLREVEQYYGCDHRAVFATTYRLLTRELHRQLERDPDFFDDPAGVGLEALRFVRVYIDTLRDYEAGREVPKAWELVLDANTSGDYNAGQDMVGSINAHVQHDMPFVVAGMGLHTPDGKSRKPDHDRINELLSEAYDDIVPAVGRRYDPFMLAADGGPSPVDDLASQQVVAGWREGVWRNAERLVRAETEARRQLVVASIKQNARAWSRQATTGQTPRYREFRDAYCHARATGESVEQATETARRASTHDNTRRFGGKTRVGTAAKLAEASYPSGAETVVIARSDEYADALAGGPLATARGAPLLLSAPDKLSAPTSDEISRLQASTAVLLGGPQALSGKVAAELRDKGLAVTRVAGANRFATAAAVADRLPEADEVFIAEGADADPDRGWPDALSAAGLASAQTKPVLLATTDRLPTATAQALPSDTDASIVGGTAAVRESVLRAVDERSAQTDRLAGPTRYATSAEVADEALARGISPELTHVATGKDFADGLVAGAAAGAANGVLVLVDGTGLDRSPPTRDWLADHAEAVENAWLAGGRAAIDHDARARIDRTISDNP